MTLVLTELSEAGIAMVADSAISQIDPLTKTPKDVDKQWHKLLRVQRIKAAISYWGEVGRVEPYRRFDEWLNDWIGSACYADLPSFAEALAAYLNQACKGQPLGEAQMVGIHVAGISPWGDGEPRPMFFHVHNGHASIELTVKTPDSALVLSAGTSVYRVPIPSGSMNPPEINDLLLAAQQPGAKLDYNRRAEPRKLFEAHCDFPDPKLTIEENLKCLANGYLTRNGDYAPFVLIAGAMDLVRIGLNTVPGVSIPRKPSEIGARIGYLHLLMQTVIRTYHCSTMNRIIGGSISSLGITRSGTYFDEGDFERSGWNWTPKEPR
jgi:hypothetical protein